MKTNSQKSEVRSQKPVATLVRAWALLISAHVLTNVATAQQTAVPVTFYVTMPVQTNGATTIITNVYVTVTNVFYTTQTTVITNVVGDRLSADMTNNVLASPPPRTDLIKDITGPTTFTLGAFPPGSLFTLTIRNPSSFPITWPPGIWPLSTLPTNELRSAVIFAEVRGEVWVSR